MSIIRYKYKADRDFGSVQFEGTGCYLGDLKRLIIEKSSRSGSNHPKDDYDLIISDATTHEEYKDNSNMIPRNTSVIVTRRIRGTFESLTPSTTQKPVVSQDDIVKEYLLPAISHLTQMTASSGKNPSTIVESKAVSLEMLTPPSTTMETNELNEDERIQEILQTSRSQYLLPHRSSNTYTCHNCKQSGHSRNHCPLLLSSSTNPNTHATTDGKFDHTKSTTYHQGNRLHHRGAGRVRHEFVPKNPTGIPRASLIHIPRHIHGAFRDPSGASVVPRQMAQLLIENSEKKADTSAQLTQQFQERDVFPSGSSSSMLPTKSAEEEAPPPNDLLCPICKQIYTDAVITPCCHNSFCDHCIRTALIESEEHECPHCHRQHVPIGQINPNLFLRKHINKWLEEQQRNSSCSYKSTVNYSSPSIIDKDLEISTIQSSTNQPSNDVETNDDDDDDDDDEANTPKPSIQTKPQPTVKTAPIVIRMQPLRRDQSPPIASTKQTDATLEDGKKSVDIDQITSSQKDVNYQSFTDHLDIGEEISNTETDTNTSEDVKSDRQSPSSQVTSTDTIPSVPLTTTTIPTAAPVTPHYYPTLSHDQHLHHNIVYPPTSSANFYPIHPNVYPPFVHPPYPGVHPSLISPSMIPPGGYHPYPLQPIYPPTHPFNGSHIQHNPINGYHVTHYETANVSSLHHPGTTYAATSTLVAHHHHQQQQQQHHEPTGQITPKPIESTLSKDEFYTRQRRVQQNKRSNSRHRSPSSYSSYTSSDSRDSSFARQRRRRSSHSRSRRYEDSRKSSPIRGTHREKRRPPPSPKNRQQTPPRDDRRPSKSRKSPPRSYHSTREKRRSPRPPPTVFQSTQRTFVYLDESSTSKQHSDRHRDHHRRKTRSKSPPSSVIVSSETRPKTLASRVEPVINEKRSSSILSNSSNKIHSSDTNSNNENKRKKHHHHSTKKYQRHRRSSSKDNRTNTKAILNETVT